MHRQGTEIGKIRPELAETGLLSLLSGTVTNMERLGVEEAITGPIMRGDVETIKRHLEALENHTDPRLKNLYCLLGTLTAKMVLSKPTCVPEQKKKVKEIEKALAN